MDRVNVENISNLAESIIDQAKKMKATAAEVAAHTDSGFSVNVRKNNVETVEKSKTKSVEVTVYFGNHSGTASTSDLRPEAISTMLEKACHIARFTEEDPYSGLAEKDLMAYNYPDLDLYHPWQIKIDEAIELAKNCEARGLAYDKHITNSEGAAVDTISGISVYANSHGFCGTTSSTKHSISCSFIAERNKEMQRDYYYTIARDPNDLENHDIVAITGAKRTLDRLGAKKIASQKSPVIFSAEIASDLISNFVGAIYGSNLYRKSSFLLDHLQEQVFAKHISIEENPHIPKALGSSPFDAEGVKLSPSNLVTDGILQRYVLDSYSARKLNTKTTGNSGGIHNLIVKTSSLDLNGLLKKMGSGLLITEFMGGGVNIVTGDYSRGIFGYWVENGDIQHPVTGITIAGNLKDILLNIKEISNDIDYRNSIVTGSILLDEITIAGS
ncbi:MAG: metalloprotease PmbA [Gammaproteobacteria bacterium]|nr:metalloprotease PmbA [Gammaproteobacteria bacterium]